MHLSGTIFSCTLIPAPCHNEYLQQQDAIWWMTYTGVPTFMVTATSPSAAMWPIDMFLILFRHDANLCHRWINYIRLYLHLLVLGISENYGILSNLSFKNGNVSQTEVWNLLIQDTVFFNNWNRLKTLQLFDIKMITFLTICKTNCVFYVFVSL